MKEVKCYESLSGYIYSNKEECIKADLKYLVRKSLSQQDIDKLYEYMFKENVQKESKYKYLTLNELREILLKSNVNLEEYKYVAQDEDGSICVFSQMPDLDKSDKEDIFWDIIDFNYEINKYEEIGYSYKLLQDIKQCYLIEEVINETYIQEEDC
jgi:hypothetical protein